jgi:hypothetical protein
MHIPYNWVLVKPCATDEIALSSGQKLFLSTLFEETARAPAVGVVEMVPDKLRFNAEEGQGYGSLHFETDMELQAGDKVIFHFNAREMAESEGRIVDDCMLISYDILYVAIRGDEIIPVNGHVIVEPENPFIKTTLAIPEYLKKQAAKKIGRVVHAGKPVRRYLFYPDINPQKDFPMYFDGQKWSPLMRPVQKDDRIYFSHYDAVPLQLDPTINGELKKVMLYRMQHKDVLAVLKEGVQVEVDN